MRCRFSIYAHGGDRSRKVCDRYGKRTGGDCYPWLTKCLAEPFPRCGSHAANRTLHRRPLLHDYLRSLLPGTLPKRSSALLPARETAFSVASSRTEAAPSVGSCRRCLASGDQPGKDGQCNDCQSHFLSSLCAGASLVKHLLTIHSFIFSNAHRWCVHQPILRPKINRWSCSR
jgi:hypothetical protein